jgi:hypothetical protein
MNENTEDTVELTTYKFRAEYLEDVVDFYQAAWRLIHGMTVEMADEPCIPCPDVTIQMDASRLPELRSIMDDIVDGHVMTQTFELEKDYTGERDYDRKSIPAPHGRGDDADIEKAEQRPVTA